MKKIDIDAIPLIKDEKDRKTQGPPYKYITLRKIRGDVRRVLVIVTAEGKRFTRVVNSRRKLPETISISEAEDIFLKHVLKTNRDKKTRAKRVLKEPTRTWAKNPGRMDVEGIDTPAKTVGKDFLKGKIKIQPINGKISVKSPYHPKFIKGARKLNGKWSPSRQAWMFDERDEKDVKKLLGVVYGYGSRVFSDKRIKIGYGVDNPFYKFGRMIVERRSRDSPVKLGEGVKVLKGEFPEYAGSRKYPLIFNKKSEVILDSW